VIEYRVKLAPFKLAGKQLSRPGFVKHRLVVTAAHCLSEVAARACAGVHVRADLLHEMAHAATNGGHRVLWQKEMRRLVHLIAPLKRELSAYLKNTDNQGQLIVSWKTRGSKLATAVVGHLFDKTWVTQWRKLE
jgi:hypothetical protein